jgi:hypothetical protein
VLHVGIMTSTRLQHLQPTYWVVHRLVTTHSGTSGAGDAVGVNLGYQYASSTMYRSGTDQLPPCRLYAYCLDLVREHRVKPPCLHNA